MRRQYASVSETGTPAQNSRVVNSPQAPVFHQEQSLAPPFAKGKTSIDDIESEIGLESAVEEYAESYPLRPVGPQRRPRPRPIRPARRRPFFPNYQPVYVPQYVQEPEQAVAEIKECPVCPVCTCPDKPDMFTGYLPVVVISVLMCVIIILILRLGMK